MRNRARVCLNPTLFCTAAQMSLAERDKKRHNLTLTELEGLPDGVNTYQACGKMFVMVGSWSRAAPLRHGMTPACVLLPGRGQRD